MLHSVMLSPLGRMKIEEFTCDAEIEDECGSAAAPHVAPIFYSASHDIKLHMLGP